MHLFSIFRLFLSRRQSFPLSVILTVPFVIQLLLAIGTISYLNYRSSQETIHTLAQRLMVEVEGRVQENLRPFLEAPHAINGTKLDLIHLKKQPMNDLDAWEPFLLKQVQRYPDIYFTGVGNQQGSYRSAEKLSDGSLRLNRSGKETQFKFLSRPVSPDGKSLPSPPNVSQGNAIPTILKWHDVRQFSAYQEALKAGQASWSLPDVSLLERTLIMSAMQPVYDANRQPLGVLFATLRLDRIGQFLQELQVSQTGEVLILSRSGQLIASSTGEVPFRLKQGKDQLFPALESNDRVTQATVQNVLATYKTLEDIDSKAFFRTTIADQAFFITLSPIQDQYGLDWLILVAVPESDFIAQIHHQQRLTLWLSVLAAGLTVLLGMWTARWLSKPIVRLNQAAKKLAQGQWETDLQGDRSAEIYHSNEVGGLGQSFQTMAQRLQQSFQDLESLNHTLEQRVEQRTEELQKTLETLKTTQQELVQAEKIAALGHLIAGVAHEINTPLGVIRSANADLQEAIQQVLAQLPLLSQRISTAEQLLLLDLLARSQPNPLLLSSREKRQLTRQLTQQLQPFNLRDPQRMAEVLVDMGIFATGTEAATDDADRSSRDATADQADRRDSELRIDNLTPLLPLLNHPQSESIIQLSDQIHHLQRDSWTIQAAFDRAFKVVFALKNYAKPEGSDRLVLAKVTNGIDTVLTLYHNKLKRGIEVRRNYDVIPEIFCYPDLLNQVWTNLIHNAIYAMEGTGHLDINVGRSEGGIQVAVIDDGCGIPEEIQAKIFQPFFTTKPQGEGTGLGLDISKTIIEKHQGRISVTSRPGRTEFQVWLPENLQSTVMGI
jgi:signal transduction histidine kinase